MVEPGGNALRAVWGAGLVAGERLLVLGPGTIGLLVAQIAAAMGIEVHLVGRSERSRTFARALGFANTWTRDTMPDLRWDAVVDASNSAGVPALALDLVEPGRRVVYIGLAGQPSLIDTRTMALKDVTAVGVLSASGGLEGIVDLYASGAVDPLPLIAATVSLEEVAGVLAGRRQPGWGDAPKIHVDPRAGASPGPRGEGPRPHRPPGARVHGPAGSGARRGDVLVRVKAVAICGSDVHGYTGTTGRRIPPVIMGHEAAGVVEAWGRAPRRGPPGTRVTFDSIVWCGDCPPCRAGRTNLCEIRQTFGVSTPAFRRDGAMAEYVVVPAHLLHRLPDAVSFDAGAMVEPAAVAMHAARISGIVPGDLVVVVGAGLIGNLAMQAARTLGAGAVAIADIVPERLELARRLGADIVIDSSRGDPATVLEQATGRRTADVVLEAVGIQATIDLATALTRPGGSLTLIGNVRPRIEQDLQGIVSGELTVRGSSASAGEYPDCIERIADGRLRVTELISRTQPLADGMAAFEALHRGEPGLMRIVLHPSGR